MIVRSAELPDLSFCVIASLIQFVIEAAARARTLQRSLHIHRREEIR